MLIQITAIGKVIRRLIVLMLVAALPAVHAEVADPEAVSALQDDRRFPPAYVSIEGHRDVWWSSESLLPCLHGN